MRDLMGLGLMILQGNTLVVVGVYVMPFSGYELN